MLDTLDQKTPAAAAERTELCGPTMSAPQEPPQQVVLSGVALLKIVQHCTSALPNLASGCLLGLDVIVPTSSTLEVTHAFPFPTSRPKKAVSNPDGLENQGDEALADAVATALLEGGGGAASDGQTPLVDEQGNPLPMPGAAGSGGAQLPQQSDQGGASVADEDYKNEMMKLLKEVNVDNNCVGWYQAMYLGGFCTASLIENQIHAQADMADNAVVLLYDPVQTATTGNLVLKALRLSNAFLSLKESGSNKFIPPGEIFTELPIVLKNPSVVSALVYELSSPACHAPASVRSSLPTLDVSASSPAALGFTRLDLGATSPFLERNLANLATWVDDLTAEQAKFQNYARQVVKDEQHQNGAGNLPTNSRVPSAVVAPTATTTTRKSMWEDSASSPNRLDALLAGLQIKGYCEQMLASGGAGVAKLFVAGGVKNLASN